METINLSFDSNILGANKILTVEVPYADSMVATSQYCPKELLNGDMELLAALNGQSLDGFVADCKRQLMAASATEEAKSLVDAHIAGLIASVMAHYSYQKSLTLKDILLHADVFSHLLVADGTSANEVRRIYPKIVNSIHNIITNSK